MSVFPPAIIVAAEAAERKWKVPASVSLAQWALESNWGIRNMGAANNCFGIKPWKAGQKTVLVDTHEEIDGVLTPVKAKFCAFDSIADCFDAHGEFLVRNSRYKPAFATGSSIEFARAIAKAGYATDKNYAAKLVDLITRYGLTQYDVTPRIAITRVPAPAAAEPKPVAAKAGAAVAGAAVVVGAGTVAASPDASPAALFLLVLALVAVGAILFFIFRRKG